MVRLFAVTPAARQPAREGDDGGAGARRHVRRGRAAARLGWAARL